MNKCNKIRKGSKIIYLYKEGDPKKFENARRSNIIIN